MQELIVAIVVGPGELRTICTRLRETHPCIRQRRSLDDDISSDIWDSMSCHRCRADTRLPACVGSGPIVSLHVQERHTYAVFVRREVDLDGVNAIPVIYVGARVILLNFAAVGVIYSQANVLGGVEGRVADTSSVPVVALAKVNSLVSVIGLMLPGV